jgi:hypothetical protein
LCFCSVCIPGCSAYTKSAGSATAEEFEREWERSDDDDDDDEVWQEVSGDGLSKKLGYWRTVGDEIRIGSIDRCTTQGSPRPPRFMARGFALDGAGRQVLGTSTGYWEGRSGRPAALRIRRVITGMAIFSRSLQWLKVWVVEKSTKLVYLPQIPLLLYQVQLLFVQAVKIFVDLPKVPIVKRDSGIDEI